MQTSTKGDIEVRRGARRRAAWSADAGPARDSASARRSGLTSHSLPPASPHGLFLR